MRIKQHIPNAITCCNLFSGCLSILFIAAGMPVKAALMIVVAGIFDFFDGFTARLLNVQSPIGGELDSLSDVVSFGVAPGFIMFWFMTHTHSRILPIGNIDALWCLAFLLPVFSAIRLARFNIDDTQKTSFRGIPAPGMALFVASLPLALGQAGHLIDGSLRLGYCIGIVLIFSFMMVSNLRFFSFKIKTLKWQGNQVRYIFIALIIIGFAIFRYVALPFIMMAYVLLSIFFPPREA